MKKLITYGLVLTLSALLVFPPLVVMAFSEANPATLRPGSTKSTRMPAPRRPMTPRRSTVQRLAGQTSTLLPDGRLLVVGGQDSDGPTATVAIAESQTGELVPLPFVLRQARAWHSATMLPDGRVLVAGGDPTMLTPNAIVGGAWPRADSSSSIHCCTGVSSAPPYSFGQCGANQPRRWRAFCQST